MATIETFTYQRKYSLSPKELNTLSHRLLQSQPPKTSDRFICYLLNGTDEFSNIARHVEKVVFWENFKLDDAGMEASWGAYEHASVARVVKNCSAGFPTLNDGPRYIGITLRKFQEYHKVENLDKVWDLSTVAVLKEYRRVEQNLVSNMLLRIDHCVAIVDKHALRIFSSLSFMGEPMAGTSPVEYEGSKESTFWYRHRPTHIRLAAKSVKNLDYQLGSSAELFKRRYVNGDGLDDRFMFPFSKDVEYDSNGKRFAKL
ncbi:hypothetical protein DL96DRAFT_1559298 [Flagelloscypha sp. PMI_526]|nr:hypothetical protein DL96DRAFT_1559298 [Flagelloscypha sp. PMI_526]